MRCWKHEHEMKDASGVIIEDAQLKQQQSFRPNNSLHLVPTTSASTTVSMNDSPSSLKVFVPLAVFLKMKGNRVPSKSTTLSPLRASGGARPIYPWLVVKKDRQRVAL